MTGGNAVDAAICSVLTSCVTESPLTGLGAGGFMLIHRPGETPSDVLVDFFVAAGGSDGVERGSELVPIDVDFGGTTQVFNVGAASCGVPGLPAGIEWISERYGSMPLAEMVKPGIGLARDGVEVNEQQAYLFEILAPDLEQDPRGRRGLLARGQAARSGGDLPLAGRGRRARALRRRRRRALLRRRGGPTRRGVGPRQGRHARGR